MIITTVIVSNNSVPHDSWLMVAGFQTIAVGSKSVSCYSVFRIE